MRHATAKKALAEKNKTIVKIGYSWLSYKIII